MNIENLDDLKKQFAKFAKKSNDKYKDFYKRIKEDREFLSGNQWTESDEKLLGKKRAVGETINFLANGVRTICNSYSINPYRWTTNQKQLDVAADKFLSDIDNCTALEEALNNTVSTGLGVLVESVIIEDGVQKPCLYSVADVTTVLLDPDSSKINGSDATEAAIYEIKSKRWVKANYGDDFCCDCGRDNKFDFDIELEYDRKNYMVMITYFVKERSGVTVYKLLGNQLCEEPITLAISAIPVIPVYGEKIWDTDNDISYQGIVRQGKAIQKTLNYAYRQLQERLAKSPKNTWTAGARSVQGFEEYYKNSDITLNPLLIYNDVMSDGKTPLAAPTRLPNTVEFADVMGIIKESLGIMQTIVGIDAIGIQDEVARSATEVISNQKTFQNNVRHYMQHLKESFKVAGRIFFELFGIKDLEVDVIEGPEETMKRETARTEIMSLIPILTDENEKKLAIGSMLSTFINNSYIDNFVAGIEGLKIPTNSELQGQQLLQQADAEIKQRDAQILQLQQELNTVKQQSELQAYSLQREMLLAEQKHNYEMEKITLEKQLDSNPAEIQKDVLEVKKAELETESEAIDLQKKINGTEV